mmetsp:Transcript_7432/g.21992  ORF Transcript_7432/g.21992 Transcript_7432/m.21992 type:complete len:331 (-) Transcript_7432:54-1046(-)
MLLRRRATGPRPRWRRGRVRGRVGGCVRRGVLPGAAEWRVAHRREVSKVDQRRRSWLVKVDQWRKWRRRRRRRRCGNSGGGGGGGSFGARAPRRAALSQRNGARGNPASGAAAAHRLSLASAAASAPSVTQPRGEVENGLCPRRARRAEARRVARRRLEPFRRRRRRGGGAQLPSPLLRRLARRAAADAHVDDSGVPHPALRRPALLWRDGARRCAQPLRLPIVLRIRAALQLCRRSRRRSLRRRRHLRLRRLRRRGGGLCRRRRLFLPHTHPPPPSSYAASPSSPWHLFSPRRVRALLLHLIHLQPPPRRRRQLRTLCLPHPPASLCHT